MVCKKIFIFLVLGLFIINFASAAILDPSTWDDRVVFHEQGRNSNYGYYEINDTDFWFFNNKPIKTIELIENDYSVFTAWNIKEIEVFKSSKLFDKTNYLDKKQEKDKSSLLSSEVHLYREWEVKTIMIDNQTCLTYEISANQTQICLEWGNNPYEEVYEGWSNWENYGFQIVQEGLYQTKTIVTRNNQNTGTIDWVDENEGHDLNKWAIWWDNDWEKRREISITENSGSSLTNYSVLLYIPYNDSMNTDFSDLRFLNSTETGELNYWVKNKTDSSFAWIWVKLSSLTASSTESIYMYYGNSGASSNSNFMTAFLFADDFNRASLGSDWTTIGGSFSIVSNYLYSSGLTNAATLKSNYGLSGNWIMEGELYGGENGNYEIGYLSYYPEDNNRWGAQGIEVERGGYVSATIEGVESSSFTFGYTHNTWYNVKSIKVGTQYQEWVEGVNIFNQTDVGTPSNLGVTRWTGNWRWDNISLREYVELEPTYIIGIEEISIGVSTDLISPTNNKNIQSNTININFTSTSSRTNLTNATSYIWWENGTFVNTNYTELSGNESVNTSFTNTLEDGLYKWNAETCGENVNCSFAISNNSFIVHVTPITIDISEPNATIDFMRAGDNQTLSWQLTEEGENLTEHVINCSYTYNSIITYLPLDTCIVTNTTNFTYVLGVNNLTFNTTDKFNLTSSETTTWEPLFNYWDIDNISSQYESTQGFFVLNTSLKDGETIEEAIFNYNDTNYSTSIIFTGGNYLITSSIILPNVSSDTNFTFSFYVVVDGITYNFLEETQEILNIGFITCVGIEDLLMNISLFDEGKKSAINGNLELNIQVYSKTSDGIVAELNDTYESIHSQEICLSPNASFSNLYLNAEIRYFTEGYATEFYQIQKSDLSNYPINLSLFDLNLSDSTEFSVTYKNDAFIFIEGAIIQLQRKYIGEDSYEVVEAPITGNGGKAVLHIDLDTNKYRISVVKDGELLDFFDNIVFNCDNELSGDCTHSLDGTVSPNNDIPIEDLIDFVYSVSINESDQTVTVLFAVPSGTPSSINVLLKQIDTFGNLTSCNTTIITSAGSITCDYTDSIDKNILELSVSKNDVQLAILNYANNPELDMDGINFFIMFLFLVSLVGMAIASPEWILIISIMVLMIGGTLLLVSGMNLVIGLGALAWLVVAIAIIIFKMAKQEDR